MQALNRSCRTRRNPPEAPSEYEKKRGSKRSRTDLLEDNIDKEVAGKKGARNKNKFKKLSKPSTSQQETEIEEGASYSLLHHNDNLFEVQFLPPNAKQCKTCGVDFCHRQKIRPFDLVLAHKERWYFPVQGDWGKKRASNKETTRYYHPDRERCITPRFPYFTTEYLKIPDTVKSELHRSHHDLLNREVGLFL